MDYTNLNEVCPKDTFSLPRMYQIIDASARHGMLSFLDAFSRYHQIPMHLPDAEKTAFIAPHGLFGNVLEVSDQDVQASTRKKHRGLH